MEASLLAEKSDNVPPTAAPHGSPSRQGSDEQPPSLTSEDRNSLSYLRDDSVIHLRAVIKSRLKAMEGTA